MICLLVAANDQGRRPSQIAKAWQTTCQGAGVHKVTSMHCCCTAPGHWVTASPALPWSQRAKVPEHRNSHTIHWLCTNVTQLNSKGRVWGKTLLEINRLGGVAYKKKTHTKNLNCPHKEAEEVPIWGSKLGGSRKHYNGVKNRGEFSNSTHHAGSIIPATETSLLRMSKERKRKIKENRKWERNSDSIRSRISASLTHY